MDNIDNSSIDPRLLWFRNLLLKINNMPKLDPQNIKHLRNIAVVGASNNPEKYGHRVTSDLISGGYVVYPVNPHEEIILGQKTYHKIDDIKQTIDLIVFVTKPEIVQAILPKLIEKNIKNAWFQPGSESAEAINFCEENNINHIENACIMIERFNI